MHRKSVLGYSALARYHPVVLTAKEGDMTDSKHNRPRIQVTAGLIWHDGRFLIARRGAGDPLAGHWEFPGGKIEPGETGEACLVREIDEELGLAITVRRCLDVSVHAYPARDVELCLYEAESATAAVVPTVHDRTAWITPAEAGSYRFAPADVPFVAKLPEYQRLKNGGQ
jgi:8-oxo-dGTP diphosphatase